MATNNAVEYGNMAYEKLSLNEDEAITLELRKHPVALAKSVIGIIAHLDVVRTSSICALLKLQARKTLCN
jgi:hypothetical protein